MMRIISSAEKKYPWLEGIDNTSLKEYDRDSNSKDRLTMITIIGMNDYEKIFVSSIGSPWAGMCGLTISEGRVRLFLAVPRRIGSPERIMIHLGVRSNEGKIIVEATENVPGSILVDYDRKKYCFYSSELVEPLKNLIRKYAHGDFMPGIYYTLKGTAVGENAVEFDFRDAVHRVVNA